MGVMMNDTTITISIRFVPLNFHVDILPRLAMSSVSPKSELPNLHPVESLPELNFAYDSLDGIMPIEAEYTFARSVEVVAFPMDSILSDYSVHFMGLITVLYLALQWKKWIDMIRELKGCFL